MKVTEPTAQIHQPKVKMVKAQPLTTPHLAFIFGFGEVCHSYFSFLSVFCTGLIFRTARSLLFFPPNSLLTHYATG